MSTMYGILAAVGWVWAGLVFGWIAWWWVRQRRARRADETRPSGS